MTHDVLDRDTARLESFSDAAFAFVATLLVVSIEVPRDFGELVDRVSAFPGFAIGFVILLLFWARHRAFFRRFGHYDTSVLFANGVVLFALLFFVFPLKWTTNLVLGRLFHLDIGSAGALTLRTVDELSTLFQLFAAGFAALFAGFLLLYLCAWRRRDALATTPEARARVAFEVRQNAFAVVLALVSVALSRQGVALQSGLPLWLLAGLVPLRWLHLRLSPPMMP